MKKEILASKHCPYCKRHCSFSDPHCGKGRALAEKFKEEKRFKEEKKRKPEIKRKAELLTEESRTAEEPASEPVKAPEKNEWKGILSEIRLLRLCYNGMKQLSDRKAGKQFYILAVLAEKGSLIQKELKVHTGLHSGELEEALEKLEKKACISRKRMEDKTIYISLTSKGADSAKELARDWKKDNGSIFASLTEEDKNVLEGILNKIIK